jgi:uncharacterized delta-60 repeat protein
MRGLIAAAVLTAALGALPASVSASGPVDGTFGTRGWAATGGYPDNDGVMTSLFVLPDDRILVTGAGDDEGSSTGFLDGFTSAGRGIRFGYSESFGFPNQLHFVPRALINLSAGRLASAGGLYSDEEAPLGPSGDVVDDAEQLALRFHTSAGEPDFSVGPGGLVRTSLAGNALAIVTAGADRVVAGGFARQKGQPQFALASYTTDGRPDPAFGRDGTVVTPVPGTSSSEVNALLRQGDGRLIAVGSAVQTGSQRRLVAIARYLPDGALDPSFGNGTGLATFQILIARCTPRCDRFHYGGGRAAVLQPGPGGEKVVIAVGIPITVLAGYYGYLLPNRERFVLARLDPGGSLDPSFGRSGLVDIDFATAARVGKLVRLPDGRLLVAGSAGEHFALARLSPSGQFDRSFGGTGRTCLDSPLADGPYGVSGLGVQRDGRVIAGGWSPAGPSGAPGFTTRAVTVTRLRRRFTQPVGCFDFGFINNYRHARVSVVLARRVRLGLLIERYAGQRTVRVGVVPLGSPGPGALQMRWNGRVGDRLLGKGCYDAALVVLDHRGRIRGRLGSKDFQVRVRNLDCGGEAERSDPS